MRPDCDDEGENPALQGGVAIPPELLAHAVRCWEAEVENARRHANRLNLLLPAILAVLGLGVFNLGWMGDRLPAIEPPWVLWIVRVLLLGSLVLFMRALIVLLTVRLRVRPRPTASFRLRLSEGVEADPGSLNRGVAAREVFDCTYGASLDLRRRNATEQARIDRGQQALLLAMLHALMAVACYTLLAVTPPRSP